MEAREAGDAIERSAAFRWSGGETRVRIEVPAELAGELDDASPFLPLALLPAMCRGEDVTVEPLSFYVDRANDELIVSVARLTITRDEETPYTREMLFLWTMKGERVAELGAWLDVDAAVIEPGEGHGLAYARRLRALGLPVIFASIFPAEQETLELEPAAYFVKPFALAELEQALGAALGHAAPA